VLLRRQDLKKFYRASPYHIGDALTAAKQVAAVTAEGAGDGGGQPDVGRYADR
jgi:hypothetical protein